MKNLRTKTRLDALKLGQLILAVQDSHGIQLCFTISTPSDLNYLSQIQ
jgi:hypothetical protein